MDEYSIFIGNNLIDTADYPIRAQEKKFNLN
jgi:hypothetical protein